VLRRDLVFFASGAAGLVYQVAWARLATRTLGADALGVALVVATFMGGMALGAPLGARLPRARPERTFAAVVALGALGAILSARLVGFPAGGSRTLDALRTVLCLLPSTLAMGATFPLMGRLTVASDAGDLGARTGDFYGANTLGAALGALLASFALLPALGLRHAIDAAAGLDLAAAGLALLWLGARTDAITVEPRPAAIAVRAVSVRAVSVRAVAPARVLLALGLLGTSSLALEIVLTRLLVGVTGASVYAFGLVLCAFLTGLGLGARQARAWLRPTSDGSAPDAADLLASAAAAAVAATALGLLALRLQTGVDDVFAPLANRTPTRGGVLGLWVSQAVVAAAVLVPPTVAFGFALPAGVAALSRGSDEGRLLSRAYLANTVGAAVGAIAAAWILLPTLGLRGATLAALVPAALAVALVARRGSMRTMLCAMGGALLLYPALGPWSGSPLAPGRAANLEVVAEASGPVARAVVERLADDPDGRALRIDGKVVASSAQIDLRLQRLLAAVPAALHGEVDDALVIGLGMGTTAGCLLSLEGLERLTVVELSPAVAEVVGQFEPWTGPLLADPRLELILADGRAFAAREAEADRGRRFDLVTADPIHPWTRGSSDLYSVEHFRRLSRLLRPGGVASQWLPLYQLTTDDLRTVVASWCDAFPATGAWLTAYDLVLVGAHEPLPPSQETADGPLPSGLERDLAPLGIDGGSDLAALAVADDAALRSFAASARPMEEDRPTLEFSAPKSFLAGYSEEALRWAAAALPIEEIAAPARGEARRIRELLESFLDEARADWRAAARNYGERLRSGATADGGGL
jgi:spermidine synthase